MQNEERSGENLRLKIVEMLVRIEHLPILGTEHGLTVFGSILQMAGRCCTHLSHGRPEEALRVARTVGRSVPHAFELGPQREALEEALEEIIAVLEGPPAPLLH